MSLRSLHAVALVLLIVISTRGTADSPAGSAYLRALAPVDPPFGQLQQDTFPYDGVRIQRWRRTQPEAEWLTVWIDLQTPGLGYHVTPIYYSTGPGGFPIQTADARTTLAFVEQFSNQPRVDLAVNAVAYFPFPAHHGTPVFLSEPVWTADDMKNDPKEGSLMLGLLAGRAVIGDPESVRRAKPILAFGSFLEDGVLANGTAVRNGEAVVEGDEPYARTAAGVSKDGRVLILLCADGRNPGVSIGLGRKDAARVMKAAGSHDAIFFDGGGSVTLVGRDSDGRAAVLNRPSGLQNVPGTLRYVGVNLGFTHLKRSDEPLPGLPDWEAAWAARTWADLWVWGRVHPVAATLLIIVALLLIVTLPITWYVRRRRRLFRAPSATG
jgi:hypothetical protein